MLYAVIDIDTATELFPNEVEFMRKSNDGAQVIVHKEILDAARPATMTLNLSYDEEGNIEEPPYPFPLYSGEEINNLEQFKSEEQ